MPCEVMTGLAAEEAAEDAAVAAEDAPDMLELI
jgi:hypothetical protein